MSRSDRLIISVANAEDRNGRRTVRIHIEDASTYAALATATMDGAQFGNLLTNSDVEVDGYTFQLSNVLGGGDIRAALVVYDGNRRRILEAGLTGEELTSILGNKDTCVSDATIYRRTDR
jgi:hypothetical protein